MLVALVSGRKITTKMENAINNIIKQNSLEIKKDIIEHLWKVIISDKTVDQYESNLMRRICGLIYFPDKLCGEIKLKLLKKFLKILLQIIDNDKKNEYSSKYFFAFSKVISATS